MRNTTGDCYWTLVGKQAEHRFTSELHWGWNPFFYNLTYTFRAWSARDVRSRKSVGGRARTRSAESAIARLAARCPVSYRLKRESRYIVDVYRDVRRSSASSYSCLRKWVALRRFYVSFPAPLVSFFFSNVHLSHGADRSLSFVSLEWSNNAVYSVWNSLEDNQSFWKLYFFAVTLCCLKQFDTSVAIFLFFVMLRR